MSDDEVKAAMTRRMNALFEALTAIEWVAGTPEYPECPFCGGKKSIGHQDVTSAMSSAKDGVTEPCAIQFALSEDAYRFGLESPVAVSRTFDDGSRFLRREIPAIRGAEW